MRPFYRGRAPLHGPRRVAPGVLYLMASASVGAVLTPYAVQPAAPWPVLAALLAAVMALAWSSGACVYIGLDQRDPRRHDRP